MELFRRNYAVQASRFLSDSSATWGGSSWVCMACVGASMADARL